MRCEKSKRLISDELDCRLSAGRRGRLEAHLEVCPDCRAYRAGLAKIQARAGRPAAEGPGPEYFAASLGRLRAALAAEAATAGGYRKPHFAPQGRWAWAGAGSLLLAAVAVFFAVSRTRTPQELFSLAFDEPLASFEHRIADNPDVASDFANAVQTSLKQSAVSKHADVLPLLNDHALQVESLTDDEVLDLDTALRSELSRTQGRI
jgi:anti-sigma factor RsiW